MAYKMEQVACQPVCMYFRKSKFPLNQFNYIINHR